MLLWRLTRAPYEALDGEGARVNGGRWNSEGIAVVYLSSTLSLAALEYLVHIDIEDVPADLVALELEVPDNAPVEVVDIDGLPADWFNVPDHPACVARGDDWLRNGTNLLLRVPSALIRTESNYLLNPVHGEAATIHIRSRAPFAFDSRLTSGK